jgi:hypothetical protein
MAYNIGFLLQSHDSVGRRRMHISATNILYWNPNTGNGDLVLNVKST